MDEPVAVKVVRVVISALRVQLQGVIHAALIAFKRIIVRLDVLDHEQVQRLQVQMHNAL